MLTPEQIKEFMQLHMKELLKEHLTIEAVAAPYGCTIDINVFFDEEKVCGASIWGSDIENLIKEDPNGW